MTNRREFVRQGLPFSAVDISERADKLPCLKPIALLIHGGADPRRADEYTAAQTAAMRAALTAGLRAGHAILRRGGGSVEAVEAAICSLEDSACFDAGRGACRNTSGSFDLDASIMDGCTGAAGAAAHLHRVRNPIKLARRVLEGTSHVLLVADGAEQFAREAGLEFVGDDYFSPAKDNAIAGTVGAVALDASGSLAAGTSTGGIHERRAGRVGDTPIIGAGTYADNAVGAISGTGQGEYFLRAVLAHDIAARVEHGGKTLAEAVRAAVAGKLTARGGRGGIIALDPTGRPTAVFNTPTLARGVIVGVDGEPAVALFEAALEAAVVG